MEATKKERKASEPSILEPAISTLPSPFAGERPTFFADRVGAWYVSQKTDVHRKEHGLYLTPVLVADFMASQVQASGTKVRLLDPSAGAGILACAAVEALVSRSGILAAIEVTAYEVDTDLIQPLSLVLEYLAEWCSTVHGIKLDLQIVQGDFILRHSEALRRLGGLIPYKSREQGFDIVIANPPYFKIPKSDPRAAAASSVVHGQPNIYGLFMAVGAAMLRSAGNLIFITPRSFTSGPYFRRFREVFFDTIRPIEVHVFGSRRDAFSRDEVLQENIIFAGIREDGWIRRHKGEHVVISTSKGVMDIGKSVRRSIPMEHALDMQGQEMVFRLPLATDDDVLALVDSWRCSLKSFGLSISTGPVIPFRATELVTASGRVPETHVPLIWMNHVQPMRVSWPLDKRKPEYLKRQGAEVLLVPNVNYVLLRRFSAKEEPRRLTAAPYISSRFTAPAVGLENHLNYIHRPGSSLSEDEVWGLTALYNSTLLDTYFRCVSGNTQVSATELRAMPLPVRELIIALGQRIKSRADPLEGLDELVMSMVAPEITEEVAVG